MKALKLYSIVLMVMGVLALFIDVVTGASADLATDLWGIFFSLPVIYYLIRSN